MDFVKLTLRVDTAAAARARRYGKRHRISLSRLVSQMFARLPESDDAGLTPAVRRLVGVLPQTVSLEEHRRHLKQKFRDE